MRYLLIPLVLGVLVMFAALLLSVPPQAGRTADPVAASRYF
jgi:hypothetical protein